MYAGYRVGVVKQIFLESSVRCVGNFSLYKCLIKVMVIRMKIIILLRYAEFLRHWL
jgi:hypothetical protein